MREDGGKLLLRARTVYLYLGSSGRVSRSSRMQWLLDHLDCVITLPIIESIDALNKPIEVLSVVPEPQTGVVWSPEIAQTFQYYIHPRSQLIFLSKRYCLTYCLDMSPSLSTVEIQSGEVLLDKVYTSLKTSLEGVSRSFVLPGSKIVFYPEIYVSIIVNTPFFTTPAQQVLVQSWRVTSQNLQELCRAVLAGLIRLETAVAKVSQLSQPGMVRPDQGFINMLRFGMLALRLLPISSVAGIIVVTDGVITLPDTWLLDATLGRLRSTGVACHFLHVGAPYHPHVAHGKVPYKDLMAFLSSASLGTHFTDIREASILDFRDLQMNHFHRAFLAWSFQELAPRDHSPDALPHSFCIELLRKKQMEESLSVSLVKVLCCRIREGYVVTNMNLTENQVDITLHQYWKHNIFIEYSVVSKWPMTSNKVHFTVVVRAPYEFLHDINNCPKNRCQAPFRQAVVSRFYNTMKDIARSDYLLVHLHSKESNSSWNVVPDSIRSGMPLFYLSSGGSPVVATSDSSLNQQFASFWKPISMLDPELWHKWLHVCRIGVLLRHDCPLPKHLHLRNASGRFQSVQCRQSATALQTTLREMATFVLIDNQTFVKLDDSTFWVICITGKPPCVVINIAFPCGVPEERRAEIVQGVRSRLTELSCPWRASPNVRRRQPTRTYSRISCCLVLQKPVEKILVRYERVPSTFETVVFPDGTQPSLNAKAPEKPGYLVTTLSRYLHHQRYIWEASVGATALARILSTLTRLRLQEGFSFAHSQAGVVTMLLEAEAGEGEDPGTARCVMQYVLFPPHCDGEDEEAAGCLVTESWVEPHSGLLRGLPYHKLGFRVGCHEDASIKGWATRVTELLVLTKLQHELPAKESSNDIYELAGSSIATGDATCISALLTFEHLGLMARDRGVSPPPRSAASKQPSVSPPTDPEDSDARIHHVPFLFNILQLLPRCRQAELLFSMPVQDWQVPGKVVKDTNASLMELIMEVLGNLNDRDIVLSEEDSKEFVEHLHQRERGPDNGPLPIPRVEGSPTPVWRVYIRAFSLVHIYLTFLPATYADLKLMTTVEESVKTDEAPDSETWPRPRETSRSVSIEPQPSLDSLSEGSRAQSLRKSFPPTMDSLDTVPTYVSTLQTSLDSLINPPENSLRVFNALPKAFRLRASSLDTNLERSRRAARMCLEAAKHASNMRTTSLETKQAESVSWGSRNSEVLETPETKVFSTILLPVFIYDCPLDNFIDSLLYKDFRSSGSDESK